MDDGRQVMAIAHTDELKQKIFKIEFYQIFAIPLTEFDIMEYMVNDRFRLNGCLLLTC